MQEVAPISLDQILLFHKRLRTICSDITTARSKILEERQNVVTTTNNTVNLEASYQSKVTTDPCKAYDRGSDQVFDEKRKHGESKLQLRYEALHKKATALENEIHRLKSRKNARQLQGTSLFHDTKRYYENEDLLESSIASLKSIVKSTTGDLANRRRRLVEQLLTVFPIKASTDGSVTMRGFEIPSVIDYINRADEFSSNETWLLGTSLGFVVHFTFLMSRYLDIPLHKDLGLYSSRSIIREPSPSGFLPSFRFAIYPSKDQLTSLLPSSQTHADNDNTMNDDVRQENQLKKLFRLFEPLFITGNKDASIITETPSFLDGTDICIRWCVNNTSGQTVLSSLRTRSTGGGSLKGEKGCLTPSGLIIRDALPRRRQTALALKQAFQLNVSSSTSNATLLSHLHPTATPVLYSSLLHPSSLSPSSIPIEQRLITYDPLISLTLSLFGIGSSSDRAGSSSSTYKRNSNDEGGTDGLPLFLRSSSIVDSGKFARGLKALRSTIHQLAWEYDNGYIDDITRFTSYINSSSSRLHVSRATRVRLIELSTAGQNNIPTTNQINNSNVVPPPINDRRWDTVSLLQPLVAIASAARKRGNHYRDTLYDM